MKSDDKRFCQFQNHAAVSCLCAVNQRGVLAFSTMHLRFHLSAPSLALLLSACDKPAVIPPPSAPKPEAQKDTADELKKLWGKLPRMDTEKAKFIAVPSVPTDPKPEEIKKPFEVKKAEPAK